MKKMTYIIAGILALIILIIVDSDASRAKTNVFVTNLFHDSKIPDEYKHYKDIDTEETIVSDKYEMKMIFDDHYYFYPLGYIVTPQNNITILEKSRLKNQPFTLTFYEYDENGNLSDTLVRPLEDHNEQYEEAAYRTKINKPEFKITPRHFQKTKKVAIYGGGGGYGNGSGRHSTQWIGELFFDVILNEETLHLKQSFLLSETADKLKEFIIDEKSIGGTLARYHTYSDGKSEHIKIDGEAVQNISYSCYDFQNYQLFKINEGGRLYMIKKK
ncbi:hypothetical protein SAMN05421741_106105 [Paenimyroides ummariense]|uniref:Uncharacterized protein n=1 Tax=Paenimyroides ummariense TaxID=913024 RepID=A0A1I4ZK44_9FLAO|nr:hypothetical protein [Paenimyroides ummariense]SFN50635.1 hypothetical protein SAMN05421741_106105 [Paenimyroides ummariense]